MLRVHFFALLAGLILLALSIVAGHQLFGEPVESSPTVPVEQHIAPETEGELFFASL